MTTELKIGSFVPMIIKGGEYKGKSTEVYTDYEKKHNKRKELSNGKKTKSKI